MERTEGTPIPEEEAIQDEPIKTPLAGGPRLRYLDRAFEIIRSPEENPLGEETSWYELAENVGPFETGLELTDNIREAVKGFIAGKIPSLKERIPSLENLTDKDLLEALAHNWFGEEASDGKRREILLATMAHIVKRIENCAYKKVLGEMPDADLEKLGLDSDTRDLLVQVLDVSIKADPMYIRFMAYSQLTPEPPEEAGPVALALPGHEDLQTVATLFPHEAQFLAQRFKKIAADHEKWSNKPGGDIFKQYLEALSAFYAENDPDKAMEQQKKIEQLYQALLNSDFPIILTPATEGYYKEPYFDPELKVSVATPDARQEESSWVKAQEAFAASLEEIDAKQFSGKMQSQSIRSAHVFGGFGVNITFNAVAQEKPSILVYLNEQERGYDRDFPNFVNKYVASPETAPDEQPTTERKILLEKISRTNTVLHELSHSIYPDDSPEAKRLGRKPLTAIDEVKAEICYRSLVPAIIEKGGLEGTKEDWAAGMLASSLQMASEQDEDDPYCQAAVFSLNGLFEQGAVELVGAKLVIRDFDAYYVAQKQAADELLAVYRDPKMTERKAALWVARHCQPNKKVQEAIEIIEKKEKE